MTVDLQLAERLFFHMAIADFFRAIRGRSHMGAFTLSLCAIDAMAYLRDALPDEGSGENFREWVRSWILPLNADCVPDVLWALRCGLVHTYGFSDAMRKCGIQAVRYAHNEPKLHWKQQAPNFYVLSLDCHVAEVTIAAFRFFDDLASICAKERTLQSAVDIRVQQLNLIRRVEAKSNEGGRAVVKATIEAPPRFADMDPALACLDENAHPDVATITREIQGIYQSY